MKTPVAILALALLAGCGDVPREQSTPATLGDVLAVQREIRSLRLEMRQNRWVPANVDTTEAIWLGGFLAGCRVDSAYSDYIRLPMPFDTVAPAPHLFIPLNGPSRGSR